MWIEALKLLKERNYIIMGKGNSPRRKIQITRREQTVEKVVMAT